MFFRVVPALAGKTLSSFRFFSPLSDGNPRPPRKVGATEAMKRKWAERRSFNPRPPRKVGATHRACQNSSRRVVSILAHLGRWALRSEPDGGPLARISHHSD
jgi:hypothetical protein